MKSVCYSMLLLALVVHPGAARPRPKAKAKPHHHHAGAKLLKQKGLGAKHSGVYHLHTHRGHHTYVKLKKGKVVGLHMKTPKGKVLQARPVRRTAGLSLEQDVAALGQADITVAVSDVVPVRGGGAMIRFTIQTPFFTISFWFPVNSVDPSAGGDPGNGGDDPDNGGDPGTADPPVGDPALPVADHRWA